MIHEELTPGQQIFIKLAKALEERNAGVGPVIVKIEKPPLYKGEIKNWSCRECK